MEEISFDFDTKFPSCAAAIPQFQFSDQTSDLETQPPDSPIQHFDQKPCLITAEQMPNLLSEDEQKPYLVASDEQKPCLRVLCPSPSEQQPSIQKPSHKILLPITFDCFECNGKQFHAKRLLARHVLTHMTLQAPVSCSTCDRRLSTVRDFWNHSRENRCFSQLDKPTCFICGVTSGRKDNFMQHFLKAHPTHLRCFHCRQSFLSKDSLAEHVRSKHAGSQISSPRLACFDCPKTFASNIWMSKHQRFVHHSFGSAEIQCPRCSRILNAKSLIAHMRTRVCQTSGGGRSSFDGLLAAAVQCFDCGMGFPHRGEVASHQKFKHRAFGTFSKQCNRCQTRVGYGFMARHRKSARCEARAAGKGPRRPFVCFDCSRAFTRACHLGRHQMLAHRSFGQSRAVCERCRQDVSQGYIKEHVKTKQCARLYKLFKRANRKDRC